jgi:hypothetical protein
LAISGGTDQPPIAPPLGTVSDGETPLEFAWISVPSFPIVLSFDVNISTNAQGSCDIQSQLFIVGRWANCSNIETFHFIGEIGSEGVIEGTAEGVVEGTPQEGSVEGEGKGI